MNVLNTQHALPENSPQQHSPINATPGKNSAPHLLKVFMMPDEAAVWDHLSSHPLLC